MTSQLGFFLPLRDEEMFPQRLGGEGAFFVHYPSPEDGGTHHSLQCDAKVRSYLHKHDHIVKTLRSIHRSISSLNVS